MAKSSFKSQTESDSNELVYKKPLFGMSDHRGTFVCTKRVVSPSDVLTNSADRKLLLPIFYYNRGLQVIITYKPKCLEKDAILIELAHYLFQLYTCIAALKKIEWTKLRWVLLWNLEWN